MYWVDQEAMIACVLTGNPLLLRLKISHTTGEWPPAGHTPGICGRIAKPASQGIVSSRRFVGGVHLTWPSTRLHACLPSVARHTCMLGGVDRVLITSKRRFGMEREEIGFWRSCPEILGELTNTLLVCDDWLELRKYLGTNSSSLLGPLIMILRGIVTDSSTSSWGLSLRVFGPLRNGRRVAMVFK